MLTLEVPVTIAVNSTSINVFDSRTVLSAVTYTAVDVASPNYLVRRVCCVGVSQICT